MVSYKSEKALGKALEQTDGLFVGVLEKSCFNGRHGNEVTLRFCKLLNECFELEFSGI